MNLQLKSFEAEGPFEVVCRVQKSGDQYRIDFVIQGNIQELAISEAPSEPSFTHELWKKSCVELFCETPEGRYIEWNFDFWGNYWWQQFAAYREPAITQEKSRAFEFEKRQSDSAIVLSVTLKQSEKLRRLGLASILKNKKGQSFHFALFHPKTNPDFHLSENRKIDLSLL